MCTVVLRTFIVIALLLPFSDTGFSDTGFSDTGFSDTGWEEPGQGLEFTPESVNAELVFPLDIDEQAHVAHLQVLLDRVHFSPGIIDGQWGRNTVRALSWYQEARGLEPTGVLDETTYAHLREEAKVEDVLISYTLVEDDLDNHFVDVPRYNHQRTELDWQGYGSALEMLSERFHGSPEILTLLNPEVDFDTLEVGQTLDVPNIEVVLWKEDAPKTVKEIVVSAQLGYLHALDEEGRILFHFPITLGSSYDPSEFARLEVEVIAHEPEFHYQPRLHGGPEGAEAAILAPGPRSAVGIVWIGLDVPGYGIHGTASPERIGYATSLGCVRLTNWDAVLLANHIEVGTPVVFRYEQDEP